jgi:hypothetical protein
VVLLLLLLEVSGKVGLLGLDVGLVSPARHVVDRDGNLAEDLGEARTPLPILGVLASLEAPLI